MSIIGGASQGAGLPDVGDIGHSLRFRGSNSANISMASGAPTSQTTWTLFCYVRIGVGDIPLLHAYISSSDRGSLYITSSGLICCTATGVDWQTSAVLRDPTTWIPVLIARNGNSSYVVEVDGVPLSILYNVGTAAGANPINSAITHWINKRNTGGSDSYGDGYRARWCFIDGAVKTTSDFMTFNTKINKWVSKSQAQVKAVVDAGGTNSRMYDFDNGTSLTTLGYDKSSKCNNATLNNFSLSGVTNDWSSDVPGNKFWTFDPLKSAANVLLSEGNTRVSSSSGALPSFGSMILPGSATSGYYAEFEVISTDGVIGPIVGVVDHSVTAYVDQSIYVVKGIGYRRDGAIYKDNTLVAGGLTALNVGDIVSVAYKNGNMWFAVNATWQNGGNPDTGANPIAVSAAVAGYVFASNGYSGAQVRANSGSRPFSFTPPTGFKPLCQANLPDIPAATLNPLNHAQVKLGTGANIKATCEAVFSGGNCLEIIKDRANSNNWQWADIVRGLSAIIQSNTTNAETTYSAPSGSSVGLILKAGGAPVTNNAGSIQSSVSANVAAGFSIVRVNSASGAVGTIGHGLPVAPRLIIGHKLSNAGTLNRQWPVWSKDVAAMYGATECLFLNLTNARATQPNIWTATAPTSTVFSVGSDTDVNESGYSYIFYCFCDNRDLPGGIFRCFSAAANASSDGPLVYLGGKLLAMPFIRRIDSAGNWRFVDTVRDPQNPVSSQLYLNVPDVEGGGTFLDACGTGIKFRTAGTPNDGGTMIGLAILGCHGKYS